MDPGVLSAQHLKVLRDNGFTRVRTEGTRRLYAVDPEPLRQVDGWLAHFRGFWEPHLDALATESRAVDTMASATPEQLAAAGKRADEISAAWQEVIAARR